MEQHTDNILEGFCCPHCKNTENFEIMVSTMLKVTSDGYIDEPRDFQWDENSLCKCSICSWISTVFSFAPVFIGEDEDFTGFNEEDYE